MARFSVYLETGDDGVWMAHVLELPGCFARAATRQELLDRIPEAIVAYQAWLAGHGGAAAEWDDAVVVEVVGEVIGVGPFDPGDAAALFPPEREPVGLDEMEAAFRLMGYAREDLQALARDLPDKLLNWRPYPASFSLRRVLRHIGNADEWYVSRIVPPETLPAEWVNDEQMPLFDFLEMSRRTAIERLRRLTRGERSRVVYPTYRTDQPEEAWSARKVLRRMLEHEREHTGQVLEILAARRRWLLARLAEERANLLSELLGLDLATLTELPALGAWTIKDLLAHIAGWDRWEAAAMQAMVAGTEPDWGPIQDVDVANDCFVAAWRERTLDEVLAELSAARRDWVAWLGSLPEDEFFRARSYHGDDWTFAIVPLRVQWEHDAEHAAQMAAWRGVEAHGASLGCKPLLRAALEAAREELQAAAALVPADRRDSEPVCGEWTLKDLLGHVADWELFGVEGLRLMARGKAPDVELVGDIDPWNAAHVENRWEQEWRQVEADLESTRGALLEALAETAGRELARVHRFPWGDAGAAYHWLAVFCHHDREHARDLRAAVMAG